MKSKLNLKINSELLKKVEIFAKERNQTVSEIIESYLEKLVKVNENEEFTSPFIKNLTGVVSSGSDDFHKSDYSDYSTDKYK